MLEQDVDGLIGWWLCSLHGRQGIAPGNRLQEIKRRLEGHTSPQTSKSTECFSFEDIDYDVPRSDEVGDDYAIPRGTTSPDYDVPNANRPEPGYVYSSSKELQQEFNYLTGNNSLSDEINNRQSGIENVVDNQEICADMYDIPIAPLEDDLPQEVYDMPRNAVDKEHSGVEMFTDQSTDLSLDININHSAGGMCNIPDQGILSGESESKQQALQVNEEPEIYSEIYDVPPVPDHERKMSLERPLSRASLSLDTNQNSIPQAIENSNSAELNNPRNPVDFVAQLSTISNDGKRQSTGSTESAKLSSEDDDYVDYQEIYGDGREKHVNVYDVPVQVGI